MMNSNNICYLNGRFIKNSEAEVGIFDRGFNFADGVYEVIAVMNGKSLSFERHIKRFANSLKELQIDYKLSTSKLMVIINSLLQFNKIKDGAVYIQVTRGNPKKRNHLFDNNCKPTVLIYVFKFKHSTSPDPIAIISAKDIRWGRCDVKSICLLPNVLAKNAAKHVDAQETVLISPDDIVRECTSSNIFMVKDNILLTHPLNNHILPGITREVVLELCSKNNIKFKESFFTLNDLVNADEVFISGTLSQLTPVIKLDNKIINDGITGPMFNKIYDLYKAYRNSI